MHGPAGTLPILQASGERALSPKLQGMMSLGFAAISWRSSVSLQTDLFWMSMVFVLLPLFGGVQRTAQVRFLFRGPGVRNPESRCLFINGSGFKGRLCHICCGFWDLIPYSLIVVRYPHLSGQAMPVMAVVWVAVKELELSYHSPDVRDQGPQPWPHGPMGLALRQVAS